MGKGMHMITFILLVIGGLNWGLVGLFNFNAVEILGSGLARIVYILVGLSAIYILATHKKDCQACGKGGMSTPSA